MNGSEYPLFGRSWKRELEYANLQEDTFVEKLDQGEGIRRADLKNYEKR